MTFDPHVKHQVSSGGAVGVAGRAVLSGHLPAEVVDSLHLLVVVQPSQDCWPVKPVCLL